MVCEFLATRRTTIKILISVLVLSVEIVVRVLGTTATIDYILGLSHLVVKHVSFQAIVRLARKSLLHGRQFVLLGHQW